jgi:uncharacterized membrane protein YedE/YeeE
MPALVAFGIGLVFGIGLLVSGMTDPGKVLAFLDLAGAWDPSLGVVMAAAVPVAALGYALARRRMAPFAAASFHAPTRRGLDSRLVFGSVLFGAGWGMAGLCPAPAVVLAASANREAGVFLLAMIAGMAAFELIEKLQRAHGLTDRPSA